MEELTVVSDKEMENWVELAKALQQLGKYLRKSPKIKRKTLKITDSSLEKIRQPAIEPTKKKAVKTKLVDYKDDTDEDTEVLVIDVREKSPNLGSRVVSANKKPRRAWRGRLPMQYHKRVQEEAEAEQIATGQYEPERLPCAPQPNRYCGWKEGYVRLTYYSICRLPWPKDRELVAVLRSFLHHHNTYKISAVGYLPAYG